MIGTVQAMKAVRPGARGQCECHPFGSERALVSWSGGGASKAGWGGVGWCGRLAAAGGVGVSFGEGRAGSGQEQASGGGGVHWGGGVMRAWAHSSAVLCCAVLCCAVLCCALPTVLSGPAAPHLGQCGRWGGVVSCFSSAKGNLSRTVNGGCRRAKNGERGRAGTHYKGRDLRGG